MQDTYGEHIPGRAIAMITKNKNVLYIGGKYNAIALYFHLPVCPLQVIQVHMHPRTHKMEVFMYRLQPTVWSQSLFQMYNHHVKTEL